MSKERTTNINKIKKGNGFTWGEVTKIYDIGIYIICEYHPWKCEGVTIKTGDADYTTINFHSWVNGRDTCHSSASLEEAITGAIAYKFDGANSQAAYYFMKMIKR
jgi:hypothetical protein